MVIAALFRAIVASSVTAGMITPAIATCVPGGQDTKSWRSARDMHAAISKVPPKSEYETTDAWANRYVRDLVTLDIYLTKSYWVEIYPQRDSVRYDADSEVLEVPSTAFRSMVYRCDEILPFQLMQDLYKTSCTYNSRGITAQDSNTRGPSYVGTNAYGASRTVERSNSEYVTLFEGPVGYDDPIWGREVDKGGEALLRLTVPVDKAPAAKAGARYAALMKFRFPLVSTHVKGFRPTFDFPTRLEYTYKTLIGDLQCVVMVVPGTELFAQRDLP